MRLARLHQPVTTARCSQAIFYACIFSQAVFGDVPSSDFFEAKIRPVLIEQCHSCHSTAAMEADKLRGGLRLDTKEAAFRGGDSGQAIVPHDAEKSLLISALKYDSLEMPPNEKLSDQVIRDFETWINGGAVWPDDPAKPAQATGEPAGEIDYAKLRQTHWAWSPVVTRIPTLPLSDSWSRNMIDKYVLQELDRNNLRPSPSAEKASWFRRVHFDLLGIPPRYDDMVAFQQDSELDAYERVVDRILASPRYGERWARHWLDIARYADNGGFNSQTKELYTNYPFAFTYRDYVIESFNRDLPYDQFIIEQLAADKLTLGEDNRALAALGFLTLGDASFGVSREDRIDDCIDTITRGLMATTVSCARCHDHKYDPVPTADYYSLFGVFKNSNIRILSRLHTLEKSQKLPALFASTKEKQQFESSVQAAESRLKAESHAASEICRQYFLDHLSDYLLAELSFSVDKGEKLDKDIILRIKDHLKKTDIDPNWGVWKAIRAIGKNATQEEIADTLQKQESKHGSAKPLLLEELGRRDLKNIREVAEAIEAIVLERNGEADDSNLVDVFLGSRSPFHADDSWLEKTKVHGRHKQLKELRSQFNSIRFSQPRAVALSDNSRMTDSHILIRGTAGKKGDVVPRQFLALLSEDRQPFVDGSGRLELAHSIVDKRNPLTARVMVNRIWLHLMGQGIVETPGDFGTRCEAPIHLDLLNFLANFFMENDWSIKKLQRLIVLSSTYRQASHDRRDLEMVDPENRLLGRMNRKRLSFEALRDSLLVSSGNFDLAMMGPAEDLWKSDRRTIYGYVNRYRIADGYLTFDFPNPSRTADRRLETMVPQQSLFLMNSPFVEEWVGELVGQEEFQGAASNSERIHFLFRRELSRNPRASELRACDEYLMSNQDRSDDLKLWRNIAHGLFLSNEFMYID